MPEEGGGEDLRKVLNLYAGIGGNRKLWTDVEVTAVEIDPAIAKIYQDFFPDDKVIVGDAHQYLLDHYDDGWDFLWSSPPCPSHSRIKNVASVGRGQDKPVYPDMRLYAEIIFLQQIFNSNGCNFVGKYCVENVIPYYEPLIKPQLCGRHNFWANYFLTDIPIDCLTETQRSTPKGLTEFYGFDISGYSLGDKERQVLRNCVHPELGKHLFDCAFRIKQQTWEMKP